MSQVEVRLQDYRELARERFDAISSIGMAEHVGRRNLTEYLGVLAALLNPAGRLLNHAISTPNGASFDRKAFIARYVFPDGELPDVAEVVTGMQSHGLDVRDVEALREHYALTLRRWSANLEAHWDEACRMVGLRRARVWRLYLVGSAVSFEIAEVGITVSWRVIPPGATADGADLSVRRATRPHLGLWAAAPRSHRDCRLGDVAQVVWRRLLSEGASSPNPRGQRWTPPLGWASHSSSPRLLARRAPDRAEDRRRSQPGTHCRR